MLLSSRTCLFVDTCEDCSVMFVKLLDTIVYRYLKKWSCRTDHYLFFVPSPWTPVIFLGIIAIAGFFLLRNLTSRIQLPNPTEMFVSLFVCLVH